MKCHGCLRAYGGGYCPNCRRRLFDGARVSILLSFDAPNDENLGMYQSIHPQRADRIMQRFQNNRDRMIRLVRNSFLSDNIRDVYLKNLIDRLARLVRM